jgi:hypothetical protein
MVIRKAVLGVMALFIPLLLMLDVPVLAGFQIAMLVVVIFAAIAILASMAIETISRRRRRSRR